MQMKALDPISQLIWRNIPEDVDYSATLNIAEIFMLSRQVKLYRLSGNQHLLACTSFGTYDFLQFLVIQSLRCFLNIES
jgi:hypothetical protein